MTRLEAIIERLKALPEERQDAVAVGIEQMLDAPDSLLTPEQWAEVDRRLANDDEPVIPHEEVVARMRAKLRG